MALKVYANEHPKYKKKNQDRNVKVAKGPEEYEEDPRSIMEIIRDEYGTWDQHDADYYDNRSKLNKKKLKKKKKKSA